MTLAGTDRYIREIKIPMYADPPLTADTIVRLYANDGPAGEPSTILFSHTLPQVAYRMRDLVDRSRARRPCADTLTWSVQLSSLAGSDAGPFLFDPPTVGSSADDFWSDDGTGFALFDFHSDPPDPSDTPANFAADLGHHGARAFGDAFGGIGIGGVGMWRVVLEDSLAC